MKKPSLGQILFILSVLGVLTLALFLSWTQKARPQADKGITKAPSTAPSFLAPGFGPKKNKSPADASSSAAKKDPLGPTPPASPYPVSVLGEGRVLDSRDTPLDSNGRFKREQLLQVAEKYPYWRTTAEMQRDAATGEERLIKQTTEVADHVMVAIKTPEERTQLNELLQRVGLTIRYQIPKQPVYLLALPKATLDGVPDLLEKLKNEGALKYSEPDYVVWATKTPNDPGFSQMWGMYNTSVAHADIDALDAWNQTTGSRSVVVGVIDTGIDRNHVDLAANIWKNPGEIAGNGVDDDGDGYVDDVYGWNFVSNNNNPMDDNNHGTHTAGTVGAVGNNAVGVTGVCWQVSLVGLKFLSASGSGYDSDAAAAVYYANAKGISITSNSWGGGGFTQTLKDAIDAAGAKGYVFVAAAGNDSANTDTSANYPSGYDCPNIISVAATDSNDRLSSFSNYGKKTVHVGAPGTDIYSTIPGNSYDTYSGTSMATPHVAGACALLKSANSSLTAVELKNILMSSVDPVSALKSTTASGGRINVYKALLAVNPILVTPAADWVTTGPSGGPFLPSSQVYTLTNRGTTTVTWTAATNQTWVGLSATSGILAAGGTTTITGTLGADANNLPLGIANATVTFTDLNVGRSDTRNVQLNVIPSLNVLLPAEIPENAGTVQGQVTVNAAPASDLPVALVSTKPALLQVPASVTIPAGQTSASFTATVIQDSLLNGTREVQVSASATGNSSVPITVSVTDDETTTLTVSLPAQTTNGAGVLVNAGSVTLASAVDADVKVKLISSDPLKIQVPATVTVLAGKTTASFNLTVLTDNRIDGTVPVTVTASVANWTSGIASTAEWDNNPRTLAVGLPTQATKGDVSIPGNVTVSGVVVSPLTVSLASSAPDRLSVPATVTIPTGASSASFSLNAADNGIPDGAATVQVSIAADGFTSGSSSIVVWDRNVDHFGFATIASPQVTNVPFTTTITAYAADNTVSKFTGTATISATNAILNPPVIATFTNGVWTGPVTVVGPVKNARLLVSGSGAQGQSNAFDVGLSAVIAIDPESIQETLNAGGNKTRTLTIHNNGDLNLEWSVALAGATIAEASSVLSTSPSFAGVQGIDAIQPTGSPDLSTVYRTPASAHIASDGVVHAEATAAPQPLENVLADLDKKSAQVTAAIPSRYSFTDGVSGTFILDGGNDIYDSGNYLSTNLGSFLPYTSGTIATSGLLGNGGRYFTRKYDGLFVLAADINAVSYLQISGTLGAGGKGNVDGSVLTVQRGNSTFYGFVKRVYNAGTHPSVNHLIIVEGDGTQTHEFSTDTKNDYHRVAGLNGVIRVYYLLYAGTNGSYISNLSTLGIMNAFLDVAGADWLSLSPISGTVAPGDSASVTVKLDALRLDPGQYQKTLQFTSNAPARPLVQVPVTLNVQPPLALTLLAPAKTSEAAGLLPGAGRVQIPVNATEDIAVSLTSSNPTKLNTPAQVTIPAGSSFAVFDLTAVDDNALDGAETVLLSASAAITTTATSAVVVTDNETAVLDITNLPAALGKSSPNGQATVTSSAAPTRAITVSLSSSDPSQLSVPATVVLPAGQTTVSFPYTIGDNLNQDGPSGVVITAQVDGWTSASKTVSVAYDDPTESWTTFGNNPAHTGTYLGSLRGGVYKQDWAVAFPNALSGVINQVAVANGKVWVTPQTYLGNFNHTLTALDTRTGSQLWQYAFGNSFSINPPSFYRGNIYVQRCNQNTDTHLWAFDGNTGAVLWKTAHAARNDRYAAPTVNKNGIFVDGGYYGGLYGFNLDGTQRFFAARPQYDSWTPAYADGVLYSWLNGDFSAFDPTTGTLQWSGTATVTPSWGKTIAPVAGGLAFLNGNGKLHAFNLTTRALAWSVTGTFSGSPAVSDGNVYIISGTQVKIFSAATGTALGVLETSDSALAGQPVVATDALVVSSATKTYLFALDTRTILQTIPYGGPVSVAGGSLYIAGADGNVRAFRPIPAAKPQPNITPGTANTVTWSATPGATHYQVQYATDAAFSAPVSSDWTSDTALTLRGLADATRQYYRVRASRITGGTTTWISAWSDPVNSLQLADSNHDGLPDDWQLQYFGTLAYGPAVDNTHTGLPNLIKYALGLDPSVHYQAGTNIASIQPGLPSITVRQDGGESYLTLSYNPNPAATKLLYRVEVSSDLVNWYSGDGNTVNVSSGPPVIVRDTVPISAQTRRFIRLNVSVSP